MSVAEWTDICGIHHWTTLRSSYRKLAWVGFEPTTTEFHSDALTDWAIRSWVQLALRANFVQLLQFHLLFSVTIHFVCCLRQSPRLFDRSMYRSELIYMVFTTERLLEVAIESWPEWDLNPRPLNYVQRL